jgi:hypothetical protein
MAEDPTPRKVSERSVPEILQGRVIDTNIANWTVDVHSDMTGRVWPDVQVAAPYLHHVAGEGIYVMPEVSASCVVCVPGDTTAPFVLAFVAPPYMGTGGVEVTDEDAVDEEAQTVDSDKQKPFPSDASFHANRPRAKPGDIMIRGRDGNFVTLHRGGVLQLGASQLAQRIYIPLRNLITDISERYEHHSVAGSINWGIQEGQYENKDAEWVQTFRVLADDKYADIKVACGKGTATKLPSADTDDRSKKLELEIGKNDPIVYEVTLAPGAYNASTGRLATNTSFNSMKFTFQVDRAGRAICKFAGNSFLSVGGKLFVRVKEDLPIEAKSLNISCDDDASVGSTGGNTKVTGDTVEIAGAGPAAARQGDTILVSLPAPIAALLPPGTPKYLFGNIMNGSSKVKMG